MAGDEARNKWRKDISLAEDEINDRLIRAVLSKMTCVHPAFLSAGDADGDGWRNRLFHEEKKRRRKADPQLPSLSMDKRKCGCASTWWWYCNFINDQVMNTLAEWCSKQHAPKEHALSSSGLILLDMDIHHEMVADAPHGDKYRWRITVKQATEDKGLSYVEWLQKRDERHECQECNDIIDLTSTDVDEEEEGKKAKSKAKADDVDAAWAEAFRGGT